MPGRDEIDLRNLGDEQLLELFSVADELNMKDYASEALDEYFAREKNKNKKAPIIHAVPNWIPKIFWHQVRGR